MKSALLLNVPGMICNAGTRGELVVRWKTTRALPEVLTYWPFFS